MTDYLNEFTLDWPHGHVILFPDGTTKPFVVKVWDWPGEFPIWGHEAGVALSWRFRADGSSNLSHYCLRNAAPPKREPREIWVNVYPNFPFNSYPKSREEADKIAHSTRIECVHFREVIEENKEVPK